jgi:hypothetical protein
MLASQRNAVPEALAFVPAAGCDRRSGIFIHHVEFTEREEFEMPASTRSDFVEESPHRVLGVVVEQLGSEVRVSMDLDPALGVRGAPARTGAIYGRPAPHFLLQLGQFGRVRYNGRHSTYDYGWWYEKVVANVALLSQFDAEIFLHVKPVYELKDLAALW